MKKYVVILFIITSLLFSGCNSEHNKNKTNKDTHEHADGDGHNHDHNDHSDSNDHDHDTNEIFFTKEQAKAVGLTIEAVSSGTFNQVIKTGGQIQAAQGDEVTIVATSNGIVSFTNSSITEGSTVKAGEALITISAKHLQDGDPTTKAKIEYEATKKEFQRAEQLVKDQIISVKEFEQQRLRYETAKTAYTAQSANVTSNGVKVTSPISGYIKSKLVSQGEYVSVGQPIATVSQNKRLQLVADVAESDFKSLKSIAGANFKMSYDTTLYQLTALNGRLISYGKASNQQSFYIPVTFEFNNIGDIIPGAFAEVFLLSARQTNIISIPVSALTEEQGLYFVYLQLDEEGYKKQEVTIGQNNGERVQIISGLNAGDKVVTHGVYQVKLAGISSVMPEGHTH